MKKTLSKLLIICLFFLLIPQFSFAEIKKATLVNGENKVVVEVGSQKAQEYFGLGYLLMVDNLGESMLGGATGSYTLPNTLANFDSSLISRISNTDTSFTLVDSVDDDGNTLSGWYGFTLDVGSPKQEYIIVNCSGASCSSAYRGISYKDGQATSSSRSFIHNRGASVSITDHPNLAIITNILNGNQATPGGLTFGDNSLSFSSNGRLVNVNEITGVATPLASDFDHAANVEYVNNAAAAGAADATVSTKGIVQMASTSPSTIGKKFGSTGARLVLPAEMASSTSQAKAMIPVTNSSGKFNSEFIDGAARYEYTGENKFASSSHANLFAASSTLMDSLISSLTMNTKTIDSFSDIFDEYPGLEYKFYSSEYGYTSTTSDITIATSFRPRAIEFHYYVQGSPSGDYSAAKNGVAYYSGTTMLAAYTQDCQAGSWSDSCHLSTSPVISQAIPISPFTLQAGLDDSSYRGKSTLSILSISDTSITIRCLMHAYNELAGKPYGNGLLGCKGFLKLYR